MNDKTPFDPGVTREWAAIKVGDIVIASVRDVASEDLGSFYGDEERRVWAWSCTESGRATCKDKGKDCGCRPGMPCPNAHATAARWWPKWGAKFAERTWKAHRPNKPGCSSSNDWGKGDHATKDEAIAEAVALGMPLVVLVDGFYRRLESVEVPPLVVAMAEASEAEALGALTAGTYPIAGSSLFAIEVREGPVKRFGDGGRP